jgi:RNA recognition motif-containing protein
MGEFEKIESGNNAQIYVAGLPYLTSEEQLVDAFRKVGKVVDVRIFNDDMCREDIALIKLKKRGRKC